MKLCLATLVLVSSGIAIAAALPAQEPKSKQAPAEMDFTAPKPGKQHEMLMKSVGVWDSKVVMGVPGAEMTSKGTMTTTKFTDFHTVNSFEGEIMGGKFSGHGVNGYCPTRKKYYGFWADSMVPSPMLLWGDYDEAKKELVLEGESVGMTGALEKVRTVTRFADADHMTWAMYGPGPDGKEMEHLHIDYTRKK